MVTASFLPSWQLQLEPPSSAITCTLEALSGEDLTLALGSKWAEGKATARREHFFMLGSHLLRWACSF